MAKEKNLTKKGGTLTTARRASAIGDDPWELWLYRVDGKAQHARNTPRGRLILRNSSRTLEG